MEETLLILQESQYYSLLEMVDAVPKWMFSGPELLQGVLIRPSAIGKINLPFSLCNMHLLRIESFRVDFRCVHRLQLLKVCDQYVHPSNITTTQPKSPRVQCISEEQSR